MTYLYKKVLISNEIITSCACRIPYEAGSIPWNRKVESQLSHALLIEALASSGIKLEMKDIAGGAGVKPYLIGMPGLNISLSHCTGLVVCAFGLMELGIDAENIRTFDERVMMRICSQEEIASIMGSPDPNRIFFRCWTLKESYGKAIGTGLGYPMREAVFFFDGKKVWSSIKDYNFTLLEDISGYVIALCYKKIN